MELLVVAVCVLIVGWLLKQPQQSNGKAAVPPTKEDSTPHQYRKDETPRTPVNNDVAERRRKLIAEKGYDPYDIESVMNAHDIVYFGATKKTTIAPKRLLPTPAITDFGKNALGHSHQTNKHGPLVKVSDTGPYDRPTTRQRKTAFLERYITSAFEPTIFRSPDSGRSGYKHSSSSGSTRGGYVYMGESDPVHRKHHYEKDENGRRFRVYDDNYDD